LLEEAQARLCAKYNPNLTWPVLVEMFAEQKDFAVRTFGMPENHGFLGVCFGPVVTANSPASRPGQHFNWEAMLWHELCHDLTPVSKLSAAFLTPKSGAHLQFAYYESSLVVQFLAEQFGFDKLAAILRDLGEGITINEAIEKHTAPMAKIENDFAAFAKQT